MHKYIIVVLMAFGILEAIAQKFEMTWQQPLPDTASYSQISLIDLDSDSLLDVIVSGKNQEGKIFFSFYRNILADSLQADSVLLMDSEAGDFIFADVNSDNFIDIIFTDTTGTKVSLNQGDFTFIQDTLLSEGGTLVRMGDLDRNGGQELVVSGLKSKQPFLHIYQKNVDEWVLVQDTVSTEDSVAIHATEIEIMDFDKDGMNDLFVSGVNADGEPVTQLYRNDHNFNFTPVGLPLPVQGVSSVSDLNHDGYLDFVLSGTTAGGLARSMALFTYQGGMMTRDTFPEIHSPVIFTGDLNSDGRCDISMLGRTAASDSVNLILYSDGNYDTLAFSGIRHQAFGDIDQDGDLDLVQLLIQDSAEIRILIDTVSERNLPPGRPLNPISLRIFDRIFLYWTAPGDDHTPSEALTYDVTIHEEGTELMTGMFDLFHERRLAVSHGNTGTVNYVLIKSEHTGDFNYYIEAVDNAYHAGSEGGGGGGICSGTRMLCDDFEFQEIDKCRHENVTLTAPPDARWFSLRDGFLAMGAEFTFNTASDTIFSVSTETGGCPLVTIYKINIVDIRTITEEDSIHACEGSQFSLNVESGWEQILWSSKKKGVLSSEHAIEFPVSEADTVSVVLTDGHCIIERNTTIIISKPILVLEDETYQVLKGESVQLNAGGGETYVWTPTSGLDNHTIANPVATPGQTTQYVVTIGDSIGCTVNGSVLVMVEQTAFIPNLFTPNDDGKNDELKAYGLGPTSNFSFSIYNREGKLVYNTENPSELAGNGWNGMVRGVKQPAGVYYWKVQGESNSGRNILLNGKTTGSIVLIR